MNKITTSRWRHNERDGVSNHQPHGCLLSRLFKRRSKKHQSSVSLAFVRWIHRGAVNSPHKWPVTRKMFPFHDVIIFWQSWQSTNQWISRWLSTCFYGNARGRETIGHAPPSIWDRHQVMESDTKVWNRPFIQFAGSWTLTSNFA